MMKRKGGGSTVMHEMTYVTKLVEKALTSARAHQAREVRSVSVKVGQMTGLDPLYLEKYYRQAVPGTILEGSRLIIEKVPVEAACDSCGRHYHPDRENGYACPACGCAGAALIRGREYTLSDMEIIV